MVTNYRKCILKSNSLVRKHQRQQTRVVYTSPKIKYIRYNCKYNQTFVITGDYRSGETFQLLRGVFRYCRYCGIYEVFSEKGAILMTCTNSQSPIPLHIIYNGGQKKSTNLYTPFTPSMWIYMTYILFLKSILKPSPHIQCNRTCCCQGKFD